MLQWQLLQRHASTYPALVYRQWLCPWNSLSKKCMSNLEVFLAKQQGLTQSLQEHVFFRRSVPEEAQQWSCSASPSAAGE